QSVGDWLRQLQAQQVECRRYAYAPLTDIQRWSPIPRGANLFETLLVFDNYPLDPLLLASDRPLQVHLAEVLEQTNYPLNLQGSLLEARLELSLMYHPWRIQSAMVLQILGHLQQILRAMMTQAEQPIQELSLLTPAERSRLLVEWN